MINLQDIQMENILDQIKRYSTVVADTGDLDAIRQFKPEDATTNPSLILKAASSGQYDDVIRQVITDVKQKAMSAEEKIEDISDRLTVAMGCQILNQIPGRVSTEVNAKLSFDTQGSIQKARRLVALYQEEGVSVDQILIKLASTWEGIRAAEVLEQEGIHCNLTLVFNSAQARACAEAGAFLISPFVGRILDWHRRNDPEAQLVPEDEPGVISVRNIYQAFRAWQYPTIVMGASFRNIGEIIALAGCDRLTISPALLEELAQKKGDIQRVLTPDVEQRERPSPMTETEYRWLMNDDAMATEKLAEGIRGFDADQRKLEALLKTRMAEVSGG